MHTKLNMFCIHIFLITEDCKGEVVSNAAYVQVKTVFIHRTDIDRPLTYGRLDLVYVAVSITSHFKFTMYADLVAVTQVKTLQAR
jgi:hypothetical protein